MINDTGHCTFCTFVRSDLVSMGIDAVAVYESGMGFGAFAGPVRHFRVLLLLLWLLL